jgi:hypothetical protein
MSEPYPIGVRIAVFLPLTPPILGVDTDAANYYGRK